MTDFSITVGYDGTLARIAQGLRLHTEDALARAVDVSRSRVEIEVLPLVNDEPPPSDGVAPNWTSERQRRAYFATDGFGAGIPYQRTDKLLQSWKAFVAVSGNHATIGVQNISPVARYVYGTKLGIQPQQFFHFVTGWEPLHPKKDEIIRTISAIVFSELRRLIPVTILKAGTP